MKRSLLLVLLFAAAASPAWALGTAASLGRVAGLPEPGPGTDPCPPSVLQMHYDGTPENGYCWQGGGQAPPDYGSFAESYQAEGTVCGIELHLTSVGYPCVYCDCYVWADDGGMPGNVVAFARGCDPCPVAMWPEFTVRDFPLGPAEVSGPFWIGYWSDMCCCCCYFILADMDGPAGNPWTKIAPGIGYPTGWNPVSLVWGPTQSIAIGAWLQPTPVPARESTWGAVKNLYR